MPAARLEEHGPFLDDILPIGVTILSCNATISDLFKWWISLTASIFFPIMRFPVFFE